VGRFNSGVPRARAKDPSVASVKYSYLRRAEPRLALVTFGKVALGSTSEVE